MIKIITRTIILILLFSITPVTAQNIKSALLPIPLKIDEFKNKKPFDLNKAGVIKSNLPDSSFITKELQRTIKQHTGIEIKHKGKGYTIEIKETDSLHSPEGYTIEIKEKSLTLTGSEAGLFYAIQTLSQILLGDIRNSTSGKIAQIYIEDAPRFGRRAVMLDPARHFLPIEDIKQFIDNISKFKYNTLQLHLTDDQGWRIEIKSHPLLTEKGAFRKTGGSNNGPDNGYYTQEQIKELVRYAAERHIEIIPEIDIPGHSVAILTAYPELGCAFRRDETKTLGQTTNMMLCANNSQVYEIYKDIIGEIAQIFPSKYIHLGGDEAAIETNWAQCNDCQSMMRKNQCDTPSGLMKIFFDKILDIVRANGKRAILWCELDNIWPPANDYLFAYPQDVTLVTWRNGLTPKCIELTKKHGHNLIMAPGEYTYLDYPQWENDLPEFNNWGMPITSLEKCYKFDPGYGLPEAEQAHLQGVMATLWGEAIQDINRVNYMFFPRGLAIAEAAWSEMSNRDWQSFKERMYPNLVELMKKGTTFRVPFEIVSE